MFSLRGPSIRLVRNRIRRGIGNLGYDTYFRNKYLFPATGYPSLITGLIGWYRADQILGLNDGDAIVNWFDESSEGNDLTTAIVTNKPLYETLGANNMPGVRFARASVRGIKTAGAFSGLGGKTGLTIAVVLALTGTTASQTFLALNTTALIFDQTAVGLNYRFLANTGGAAAQVAMPGDASLIYMDFDTGNDTARISVNSDAFVSNTVDPTALSPGVLTVGDIAGATASDCIISEIVIYDHRLVSGDEASLKGYLKNKFATP